MGKLRGICNDNGDVEALPTCPDRKHGVGVEHRYCLRKRSTPSKSVASQMRPQSSVPADSFDVAKSNPKSGPSKYLEQLHSTRFGNAQNNASVQKDKGVKLTKDATQKNSDAVNVVFTVEEFYMKAAAEEPLQTNPAQDASWTGTFILKDEKNRISFKAHPTSEGLSKVKEFSKSMPEVLEFELCSYENFLRTVFKGCDPDDQDIGLYFFPDEMNRPNTYISLLEQLSGNCFLKTCIDGVELLVFTSRVLHKDYLQQNKCDFLWGIYRRCHRKLKGAVEETMVVDMDIDSEDPDVPPVVNVDVASEDPVIPPVVNMDVASEDPVVPPVVNMDVASEDPDVPPVVNTDVASEDPDVPPGFSPSMRGWWLREDQKEVPPGYVGIPKIKEEVL